MATDDLDILLQLCRERIGSGKRYSSEEVFIVGGIIAQIAEAQGALSEDERCLLTCASFLVLRALQEHDIPADPTDCWELARNIYVIGKAFGRQETKQPAKPGRDHSELPGSTE